jgi:hypothetical protein
MRAALEKGALGAGAAQGVELRMGWQEVWVRGTGALPTRMILPQARAHDPPVNTSALVGVMGLDTGGT